MINLGIFQTDAGTVICLRGRFDSDAVGQARSRLEHSVTDYWGDVYVDLSAATFIDSSTLGSLVFLFKRLAVRKRKMVLIGLTGQPRQVIEYLRIDHVIDVLPRMPAFIETTWDSRNMHDDTAA